MHATFFAGLTELEPGEPIATDGSAIAARNPSLIDHFLKIGCVTHRHDAHPAMANPTLAPSATVLPSGGAIPADLTIEVGYTLTDSDGGETILSDTDDATTQGALPAPDGSPNLEIDYTGGSLRVDTYFYGISFLDDAGGETGLGPMDQIERSPGFPSGRVQVSGLLDLLIDSGAAAWKLYRATGGTDFAYLASGVTDTFTDDGTTCADCNTKPPREGTNSTNQTSVLQVTLPGSGAISSSAQTILVYATLDGSFSNPALLGEYPVASAGATINYPILDFLDGRPPFISTCIPGANLIDPDTELLDWHWKRPVASSASLSSAGASSGDVRVALDNGVEWVFIDGEWIPVPGTITLDDGTTQAAGHHILVRGSGGASAVVSSSAGLPLLTVIAGGGGGGASGITIHDAGTTYEGITDLEFTPDGLRASVDVVGTTATIFHTPAARTETTFGPLALASGASGAAVLTLAPGMRILRVSVNQECRIRIYTNRTDQDNDAGRAIGVDPTGDHGLVYEHVFEAGDLVRRLGGVFYSSQGTPHSEFTADDTAPGGPLDGDVPVTITNLGAVGDVEMTMIWQQIESFG